MESREQEIKKLEKKECLYLSLTTFILTFIITFNLVGLIILLMERK